MAVDATFGTLQSLTVTNLHSLGDGNYWESANIDNGTVLATWVEVFLTLVTTTTAATEVGNAVLYMAGSVDGGVDHEGGADGTEGAYANTGDQDALDLTLIGAMVVDATETSARTYRKRFIIYDPPEDFSLVIRNISGQALGASGNLVEYRLNKHTSS